MKTIRQWLMVLGLGTVTVLHAATITWTNAAGGDFNVSGNWSPNIVPGSNDSVVFQNMTGGVCTITWSQSATNSSFTHNSGNFAFDLQSGLYRITNTSAFGNISSGDVLITNGVVDMRNSSTKVTLLSNGTRLTIREAKLYVQYLGLRTGPTNMLNASTLMVDGPGSKVEVDQYLHVGRTAGLGWGSLIVTNGGGIYTKNNSISLPGGDPGCAWGMVAGSNSILYTIYTGLQSIGSDSLTVTGILYLADGGTYAASNANVTVRSNGVVTLNNGTLSSKNGAGIITNSGVVEGTGQIIAKEVWNPGVIRPGGTSVAGALTIRGSFLSTNGTVAIELGGAAANQCDRLIVTNKLFAGGTLGISLINGFTPPGGTTFKILDFASVTGMFSAVDLPGDAMKWNLQSLYTTGEILYRPLPKGAMLMVR